MIEYASAPSNPPPGFEGHIIAIQHDYASTNWTYDGTNFIPPLPNPMVS